MMIATCRARFCKLEILHQTFRTNALKLVVLITDAGPGGFCDGAAGYTTNSAHLYALEAATNHIQINAIQMNNVPDATPVMQDYETNSVRLVFTSARLFRQFWH